MDHQVTIDPSISFGQAAPGRYYYQAGDRPLDGITIKRAIGRGGFGEVYFAVTDAGKQIALKHITRAVEVERRGAAHCMNLKSPNLIGLFDIRSNAEGASFVLMEYVSGPTLKEYIDRHPKGLPDSEIKKLMSGLVAGVAELHSAGIVHRDLKPANVFVEDGIVKVGDYGLSKTISEIDRDHSVSVGTCHYMAPEIRSGRYDKPVDTYALGVILYEMITGRPPFEGQTAAEILMRHQFDKPNFDVIPPRYRKILIRALDKDPSKRPSDVREIARSLDQPENHSSANWQPNATEFKTGASRNDGPSTSAWNAKRLRDQLAKTIRGADAKKSPKPTQSSATDRDQTNRNRWSRRRFMPSEVVFESPPWPSDRRRARGLVRSIIWTIAGCWLLASPLGFLMMVNMSEAPNRMAFVAVISSLMTSVMLILQYDWEQWEVSTRQKRIVGMTSGGIIGVVAAGLAVWLGIEYRPEKMLNPLPDLLQSFMIAFRNGAMMTYAITGALVMAIPRWWKMLERDRPSRWSLRNLARWGLWCFVLSSFGWQSGDFSGHSSIITVVFAVTGVMVQFVSPWDAALADYAQLRRFAKRRIV